VQSSTTGQNPEPATIGELIRHEVQRPTVVGRHRNQHRCSCAYRSLSAATLAHRQLLLAIEPEELLVVHKVSLAPEQHMKASIAEAAAFVSQRLHALAKALIVAASSGKNRWLYTPAVRSSHVGS
jgi:hypothetical protein